MTRPSPRTSLLILTAVACLLSGGGLWAGEQATPAEATATPWGADYFPNTVLTNQDGQNLRFYDDLIKGKVVVINFIFTGCGDSCPLETARLRQVQKLLGDRVGKDVFFYSISIDPLSDTPAVLKQYAEKFKIGPGWQFLTGDIQEIADLRQSGGQFCDAELRALGAPVQRQDCREYQRCGRQPATRAARQRHSPVISAWLHAQPLDSAQRWIGRTTDRDAVVGSAS